MMWVISEHGFYNIVCQDNDLDRGLLTFKARDKRDLENLIDLCQYKPEIQESDVTDYRFRTKIPVELAVQVMASMVGGIDYPKTKPRLSNGFPEREAVHLAVWADLYSIQTHYEKTVHKTT